MHSTLCRCLLILFLVLPLSAQVPPSRTLPLPPSLRQITQRAGTIFAGKVTSITPVRAIASDQIESVQVTFQVEQAIRGARMGQTLTIREWAGLWSWGERYQVGERLMLFLYSPSKIGLTSPVAGSAGRFRIGKDGQIQLSPQQAQTAPVMSASVPIGRDGRVPLREFMRAVRRWAQE
jgi:hypothetical protein